MTIVSDPRAVRREGGKVRQKFSSTGGRAAGYFCKFHLHAQLWWTNQTSMARQILSCTRAVIKSRGLGISTSYSECGPRLLSKENKRKIEPKETPSCLIPHLLLAFTRQLEIFVTSLMYKLTKRTQKMLFTDLLVKIIQSIFCDQSGATICLR